MAPAERTIGRLWRDAVASRHASPPYLAERDGDWHEVSWEEAAACVDELANGLLALGVSKGDAFGIISSTRVEWAYVDFALALVGAVTAPVYANSSPEDCRYLLNHSESVGAFVEDEGQRAKVEAVRDELPQLRHVITFADLDSLREQGRRFAAEHPDALAEAESAVGPDDLFTYIYTSGTTGPPKGCMILHRNYYAMVAVRDQMEDNAGPGDVLLLYLPLAHNFGRLVHLSGPYAGFTLAFCSDPYMVADALLQVRPTVFPSVPRIYEKVHTAVVARFDATTGPSKRLLDWALSVGSRVSALREAQRPVPRGLAAQHRIADRLVYSKVKERLGGRLRIALSGGAPLAPDVLRFFHSIDILILEGYGLTECTTAASANQTSRFRFGTVGQALPGWELKLADDGELFIRSPTIFAGYLKDKEATRAILGDDGWLATGDIATIDDDGYVTITDRKKDILVTAGGKNVAPQNLENELKTSQYVSQALVVGDRRPYVAALVTLDPVELESWARQRGLDGGHDALTTHPEVLELVQSIVDDVNASHSRFEQIKRFAVLQRDFSADEGEVTPTLKLRRKICAEHFSREIEQLYDRSEEAVGERRRRLEDSSSAHVRGRVPAVRQARDLHDVARVRRVDELPSADVDAHVAEPVEEDEVARRELVARHGDAVVVLRRSVMRQRHAHLRIDVHREARAVEAGGRRPAPYVRDAEVLHRDSDDSAVTGRRGDRNLGRLERCADDRRVERLRLGGLLPGEARCRLPGEDRLLPLFLGAQAVDL